MLEVGTDSYVTVAEADEYIAGYTIMNDMSARGLQMEEMKLNLGPAKGKDFSTARNDGRKDMNRLPSHP